MISTIPARADLDQNSASSAACLPYFGVGEQVLCFVDRADDRPQAQAAPLAISRVTFRSGHSSSGRPLTRGDRCRPRRAAAQRLGGVADAVVIDAGHEPVAHLLQRVQVAGALQLVDPLLGDRVQGDAADQRADRPVLPWRGMLPISQLV